MIDKDQIIKAQQEKIERIEQLQTVKFLDLPDELKLSMNTIHDVSHTIKDVLNGMSPKEAIEKNMAENEEEE